MSAQKKPNEGIPYDTFLARMKAKKYDPLYTLLGPETYLVERCLKQLYARVPAEDQLLNTARFSLNGDPASGERKSGPEIILLAREEPMFAECRVVLISNVDKANEEDSKAIISYLARPSDATMMIFQATNPDRRRKLTTALLKMTTVVNCDYLEPARVRRFAEEYLKRAGSEIDKDALDLLMERMGVPMIRLTNELNKLATCANGAKITLPYIKRLTPRLTEHSNFDLTDLLLKRDARRAIVMLDRLLADGNEPLAIIGSIAWVYRRILMGKNLVEQGMQVDAIGRAVNQYGPKAREFVSLIRRIPKSEVFYGLKRLAEVDRGIKSSSLTPEIQLRWLIVDLMIQNRGKTNVGK